MLELFYVVILGTSKVTVFPWLLTGGWSELQDVQLLYAFDTVLSWYMDKSVHLFVSFSIYPSLGLLIGSKSCLDKETAWWSTASNRVGYSVPVRASVY